MKPSWKEVCGSHGKYIVSDRGEVKSLISKKTLKIAVTHKGYERVCIYYRDGRKNKYVHRLVAEAFIDKDGSEIDHIDGNKLNNHASNLRWCSRRENMLYHYKNECAGTYYREKDNKWCAAMSVDKVTKFIGSFITRKEASNAYFKYKEGLNNE